MTGFATFSADLPTTVGAPQTTYGGDDADAFLMKLDATGTVLLLPRISEGAGRTTPCVSPSMPRGTPTLPGIPADVAVPYATRSRFSPLKSVADGYSESRPEHVEIGFTAGSQQGYYAFFVALVRPGALADNRIDADDILALDVRFVEVLPPGLMTE